MAKRHFHLAPNIIFLLLALGACARSNKIDADVKITKDITKDAEEIAEAATVKQKAAEVAATVRQKAQVSEKAEGSQDLVKDKVDMVQPAKGDPVIEQTGEASSYGRGFEGKATANGEKFNKNDLTAAHPTLPLGTKAKVTNLDNGKSVDVRINDRGPYVKGRDIDVSQGAAKKLDITKTGIAPVKIEAKILSSEKSSNSGNSSPAEKKSIEK